MTTAYVGGLRDRLIHDSLYNYVKNGLTAIGWMNSGRRHEPLTLVPEQKDWEDELALNTITVSPSNVYDEQWELGSYATKNTTTYWIDVYGESEALGLQISGDIRDILRGKFTTLGFGAAELPVMDYTQDPPIQIFYCDIEHVRRDRAQNYSKRFQRFLYMISVDVIDYYSDDVVIAEEILEELYGGSADSVYLPDQDIDGEGAISDYTIVIGGNALDVDSDIALEGGSAPDVDGTDVVEGGDADDVDSDIADIEGGDASDVDSIDFSVDGIGVDAGSSDSEYLDDQELDGGTATNSDTTALSGGDADG